MSQSLEQTIDTIAAIPSVVELSDGRKVAILKVKVAHLSHMIRFVNKVVTQLGVNSGGEVSVDLTNPATLLTMLSDLPDDVAHIASLLTDLPAGELEQLGVDDGLTVVTAIITVNHDFFMKNVRPKIDALMQALRDGKRT